MLDSPPIKRLPHWLAQLESWLFEPAPEIQEPGQRRRARLLSVFTFCLLVLFAGVEIGYRLTLTNYQGSTIDNLSYIFMALAYLLSRTRYTHWAAWVLLGLFPFNVFTNILGGSSLNPAVTLFFLTPGYILASIFFNTTRTAIYSTLVSLGVILLPYLAPTRVSDPLTLIGPFSVGVVSNVLLIIGMINRNLIERDRQAELRHAYDDTLLSWSRALEIRDNDTQEHSKRVTQLTLALARAYGLTGRDLENIHRGALLHDVGKMGIPDSILLKPAGLDEAERKIMQTHVMLAEKMLSPISFLRPALDIPLYHHEHERWDGQGYLRGLTGEQIPLAARIFAVVDVWDALTSDRPYRPAWTEAEAIAYLKEQSGKQFDPEVIKLFLELVKH